MKKNYLTRFRGLGLLVILGFLIKGNLWSQVGAYGFQESSGTYAPLAGGTNSTAAGDDGSENGIALGFTFNFGGVNYTHFCINTNGWIRLGNAATTVPGTSWVNELNPAATAHEPLIAAYWDDHNRGTGSISYLVTGTAPNQVLEVNWNNVNVSGGGATGVNTSSFLLRLYEGNNQIEFIYDGVMNTIGAPTASIGLADLTSFKSVTPGAPGTASNAAANNGISTLADVVGKRYLFVAPPATPPTPVQDIALPTCSAGTNLTASGTPDPGITWYWQTSAAGTSTATAYSGPYTVYANGTYYLRAFDAANNLWSLNSSSVTVSNFPLAVDPPAPTADFNPSCVTTGSVLSEATAPAGYEYYWQGTTVNGTSNALNASSTYSVTTSGTYYVSAYETASQCWSNTVGLAVTVDTYIPGAPTAAVDNFNICSGVVSFPVNATPPNTVLTSTTSFGTNLVSSGTGAATFNITAPTLPAGSTITSAQLELTNVNSVNGSWRSEIRVALTGAYVLAPTQISALNSGGLITPDPTINLAGFPTTGGALTLSLTETFDDGGAGTIDANYGEVKLVINYNPPPATISWYDAASLGNNIGSGSPFETVGTPVLPNTSTSGAYVFYAGANAGGCSSTARLPITVNVTEVLADLIPVNATCNGGDNGSFTLGTIQCGAEPFTYSINGGLFGPIPTDLVAGTYSVVIQDAGGQSAPITVVITEPAAPSAGIATNVTYYNATLGWTTTGNETSWTIIYGPAGFDPSSSGIVITGATNPYDLTGVLDANTNYEFYVLAECGPAADTSAAFAFSTDAGFYTYDNTCGPGFIDISTSGVGTLVADETSFGMSLPFTFMYQGAAINDISIADNGSIILGTQAGNAGFGNTAIGGATPNGLYAFWDDLDEATVYTETVGVAPNRQFIVQWEARPLFIAVAGQEITFEVIIEETTNEVYFLYEDVVFGGSQSFNDYGASATIGAAGPSTDVQVSFNNNTYLTNNSCVHFYDVLCPNPTNLTSLIFADDAILDWDAGLYGEVDWTIIYGPAGFDPLTSGTTMLMSSSDASFGGTLTQLTEYDVYIYSECAADNLTSPGLFLNFTTLPYCSIPSALTGDTDVDSLELAWNWTASSGTYPVTSFNISYVMAGNGGAYDGVEVVADGINFADTIFNTNLLAGGVYEVYVQAACAGTNDTSSYFGPITLVMPLTNDTVCGAENLAVDGTLYTFNNSGATVSLNEAPIAPPADGAQVTTGWVNSTLHGTTWFTFTAPASGSVRVNGNAINYNGQIGVYEVTNCDDFSTFSLIAANDNEIGGPSLAPNFTICGLTPGDTYYLMQDGFNATTGDYSITITPIVLEAGTANPVSDICTGSDIDLFTTVTGNNLGGVWSSDIAAVNASINGSDFTSNGLAYDLFNFQYRVTDGCAYDSIITQVNVFPPSDAGDDGSITACRNEPIDLLSGLNGTADLNGTWYDPSNNAIASSAIVTSNIAGQFNYDYIVGNGVCPNDTANVVVNVLPTCNYLELADELFYGVSLFPNPSEGTVFIASDATQSFDYAVTDANGRIIKEVTSGVKAAQTTEINLNNMETGVYFIKLSNDQAEKVFRVVIQ